MVHICTFIYDCYTRCWLYLKKIRAIFTNLMTSAYAVSLSLTYSLSLPICRWTIDMWDKQKDWYIQSSISCIWYIYITNIHHGNVSVLKVTTCKVGQLYRELNLTMWQSRFVCMVLLAIFDLNIYLYNW